MEDAVQILLVFFDSGWLPTAKLGSLGSFWEQWEEGREKERQVRKKAGREQAQPPRNGGPRRVGKGSPSLPRAPEAPRWPKACWTAGRSSCPAGDSLRSPSWCPGRTTESGARPSLRAAHPKGTGKSLVFCVFFLLEGLVSNQRALAGARNVVARCARQLSQSESRRAAATLLQCAESNPAGIGLELRRPLAPGKGARGA